jgi:DNA helicase-2/ATP-dependent DNA helicase PcrA
MEQCYLSFARQRFRNGSFSFASPSRFLQDIDRQYFALERKEEPRQPSSIPSIPKIPSVHSSVRFTPAPSGESWGGAHLSCDWHSGDRVSHRVFGTGTVQRVYRDEVTENDKIEIKFDTQGVKTLLLTHAKLEKA